AVLGDAARAAGARNHCRGPGRHSAWTSQQIIHWVRISTCALCAVFYSPSAELGHGTLVSSSRAAVTRKEIGFEQLGPDSVSVTGVIAVLARRDARRPPE